MKLKLLSIGIIILLLAIGLSGCNSILNFNKNEIIGFWYREDDGQIWEFLDNNTYYLGYISNRHYERKNYIPPKYYEIKDKKLYTWWNINLYNEYKKNGVTTEYVFMYTISNDNTLVLKVSNESKSDVGTPDIIFHKINNMEKYILKYHQEQLIGSWEGDGSFLGIQDVLTFQKDWSFLYGSYKAGTYTIKLDDISERGPVWNIIEFCIIGEYGESQTLVFEYAISDIPKHALILMVPGTQTSSEYEKV